MFQYIILLFLAIQGLNGENSNFRVEKINNSSGLYQEALGTIHMSTNTWRFDVILNLTSFKVDSELLFRSINYTRNQCQNEGKVLGCEAIAMELSRREQSLQIKIKDLLLLYNPKRRQQRDLLDKVGSVANVLFGIMDSQDAQKIYSAIDELTEDSKTVFEELDHHRTTVNSIIRAFNETTTKVNQNFLTIKSKLSELSEAVNDNKKELYLSEIQTILFSHIYLLDQKIAELNDILIKAHDGMISGKLFRLKEFSEAIARLHFLSAQGIKLPFEVDKLHLKQLNTVADIEGYYMNDLVIVSITIPLSASVLDLFKSTSIPIPVDQETYAVIDNKYPYIAYNQESKDLMLFTEERLSSCVKVEKTCYVCSHSVATYTDKSKNCIRGLINGHSDYSNCNIKGFKTEGEFWESLATENHWLFVISKAALLHIACLREKTVIEISGIGIFHLKPPCRAYTNEVELLTVSRATELASFTINIDTKILANYNFTALPTTEFERSGLGHVHLRDVGSDVPLKPLANSTYQQKRTMDKLNNQHSRIRLYEILLIGIAIGMTCIILGFIIFKFRTRIWAVFFLRNKRTQTEQSIELPQTL